MDKVSIDQVTRWTWIALALPLLALAPLLYMQSRVLMLKPHLQFFPIAILAAIYFLIVTLTGLALRMLGRDPLRRRFERGRASYWDDAEKAGDAERYFRQH